MSGTSFTRILLSLAFVVLTTTLITHHHSHAVESHKVESNCTICVLVKASIADGHTLYKIDFERTADRVILVSQSFSIELIFNLKARDPPYPSHA